jgi:hypothetical protein
MWIRMVYDHLLVRWLSSEVSPIGVGSVRGYVHIGQAIDRNRSAPTLAFPLCHFPAYFVGKPSNSKNFPAEKL